MIAANGRPGVNSNTELSLSYSHKIILGENILSFDLES